MYLVYSKDNQYNYINYNINSSSYLNWGRNQEN